MAKSSWKAALACGLLALVAACGGGGGSSGAPAAGGGGGGGGADGTDGAGQAPAPMTASLAVSIHGGDGQALDALEPGQAATVRARLARGDAGAVGDQFVSFTEMRNTLLAFSPASGTALTNAEGVAEIGVTAAAVSAQEATAIQATVTLGEAEFSASQVLRVTPGPALDPQQSASAVSFEQASPSDRSIVIAGSGGGGRSTLALLTFKVVDARAQPVARAVLDFSLSQTGLGEGAAPRLLAATATTDAEGLATASVVSGSSPASVVVNAAVRGRPDLSVPSGTLTVTTREATARGFDLSAGKYVLNADLSGDSTDILVSIVDANGNPVADGVAVTATANYGRVGSASRGGCVTADGRCSVAYAMQDPRPADGEAIQVAFDARLGSGEVIASAIQLYASSLDGAQLWDAQQGGAVLARLDAGTVQAAASPACSLAVRGRSYLGTAGGAALPSGTQIVLSSATPGLSVTLDGEDSVPARAVARTSLFFTVTGTAAGAGQAAVSQGEVRIRATHGAFSRTLFLPVALERCD